MEVIMMEQTPSTFQVCLPTALLDVCCSVAEDEIGKLQKLHAITTRGEDIEITVRRGEEKEGILLLFQGAAGSIINVLNNQWSCSIESVDLLPQPDLSNTDVAQNLSAAKRQPKTSAHSAETETVGETMTDACEKPAATEILEHQTSEKHLTSNETKTQSGRSRRTSRRLQDRQQRLSTHGCTSNSFVEIASRNTYYKSEYRCDDAEVDREDAAHSKTGSQDVYAKIDKQQHNTCKASRKRTSTERQRTTAGNVLVRCSSTDSVKEATVLTCVPCDQSDTSVDGKNTVYTSLPEDSADSHLKMECSSASDVDNEENDQSQTARIGKKKRRTITDPNVQPYLCPECGHQFIVAISMMRHVSTAHSHLPNYGEIVSAAEDLRTSRLKAASAILVLCPVCRRNMRGTRVFMHMRKWHADNGDFDSLMVLAKKQYYAERERVYKLNNWGREKVPCPQCGLKRARRRLSHHVNFQCKENSQRQKFLRCRHCGYGSRCADRLAKHMKLHQDGTNFICDHCGKRYVSRAGLTVHLRQKHQEAKRNPIISHTCHVCGKAFIHESRLKMHMAIHADERAFICDVCGSTFKERGTMRAHHRTQHLGQYRYRCDKCGHGVEKRSYLHTHRCHVDASVAEQPVTGEHSYVAMVTQSEAAEIGAECAVVVEEVICSADMLAMDGTGGTPEIDTL